MCVRLNLSILIRFCTTFWFVSRYVILSGTRSELNQLSLQTEIHVLRHHRMDNLIKHASSTVIVQVRF